ncbi:MAG: hypothetical protein PHY05_02700 [Methanothrix sp.]|nr:hypothetical protein [Methanothrix sp.]
MTCERGSEPEGALERRQEISLVQAAEEVQKMLEPLRQGEFSLNIGKISVYVQSAAKARDAKTLANFIRFAHLNLDAVLVQALKSLVFRPRLASKADEQKKATALQKTFDRLDRPAQAMREHYQSSSDPLNKYLVAGPWGHEYLKKRGIDLEDYDRELCQILGCQEMIAGKIVLGYTGLRKAIDLVEVRAIEALI